MNSAVCKGENICSDKSCPVLPGHLINSGFCRTREDRDSDLRECGEKKKCKADSRISGLWRLAGERERTERNTKDFFGEAREERERGYTDRERCRG